MKPIWTILITVVATAAVVGGGTWYLIDSHAKKDKDKLQTELDTLNQKIAEEAATSGTVVTSGTTATTGATVADPTASWNVGVLADLNLSIKYPATLGAMALATKPIAEDPTYVYTFSKNDQAQIGYATGAVTVGRGGGAIELYFQRADKNPTTPIKINGIVIGEIYEEKASPKPCTSDEMLCRETDTIYGVYFKTGLMYSNIVLEQTSDTSTNRTIMENMIKSISPVDVTADWKTYTVAKSSSLEYDISFKYPSEWTMDVVSNGKTPSVPVQFDLQVTSSQVKERPVLSLKVFDSIATLRNSWQDYATIADLKTADAIYLHEGYINEGLKSIGSLVFTKYSGTANFVDIVYVYENNGHTIAIHPYNNSDLESDVAAVLASYSFAK